MYYNGAAMARILNAPIKDPMRARGGEISVSAAETTLEDKTMTQAPGTVLDYERTLILAIELSNRSWVLAAQIPGLPAVKAKRSIDPTPEALMAAIEGYRARAEKRLAEMSIE
jgi:hypothetical protein